MAQTLISQEEEFVLLFDQQLDALVRTVGGPFPDTATMCNGLLDGYINVRRSINLTNREDAKRALATLAALSFWGYVSMDVMPADSVPISFSKRNRMKEATCDS